MKKRRIFWLSTLLILVLLTLFVVYKVNMRMSPLYDIKQELHAKGMVIKKEGNLFFSFPKTVNRSERKEVANTTRDLIAKSLEFINETSLEDSILIVLVPTLEDMEYFIGDPIAGISAPKNYDNYPEDYNINISHLYTVYKQEYNALGKGIMDMVSTLKWGQPKSYTFWLVEGLATLFAPETLDCDGHTFEERYVYFLQSGKLLATDSTENVNFIRDVDSMAQIETDSLQVDSQVSGNDATREILDKIYWSQTAYIVGYLLDNYGIEKYKHLWQSGMSHFDEIYGISFDELIRTINDGLNKRYPDPIDFNWDIFKEKCMK